MSDAQDGAEERSDEKEATVVRGPFAAIADVLEEVVPRLEGAHLNVTVLLKPSPAEFDEIEAALRVAQAKIVEARGMLKAAKRGLLDERRAARREKQ